MAKFHIGTLLTISDGKLIAPNGIDDVYSILQFMTGQPLMTHSLPTAMREMQPVLLRQHPWLAGITVPEGLNSKEKAQGYLLGLIPKYGEFHEVKASPTHIPFSAGLERFL